MAYGKGTFIDAYGFKLCVEDAVIQHVKSNAGYGSGRAGTSPYAAIFFKKSFAVRQRKSGICSKHTLKIEWLMPERALLKACREHLTVSESSAPDIRRSSLKNSSSDAEKVFLTFFNNSLINVQQGSLPQLNK